MKALDVLSLASSHLAASFQRGIFFSSGSWTLRLERTMLSSRRKPASSSSARLSSTRRVSDTPRNRKTSAARRSASWLPSRLACSSSWSSRALWKRSSLRGERAFRQAASSREGMARSGALRPGGTTAERRARVRTSGNVAPSKGGWPVVPGGTN